MVAPCRDGFWVLTLEWVPPISGESDLPFSDHPSDLLHTTNWERRGPRWPVRTSLQLFRVFIQPVPVTMFAAAPWTIFSLFMVIKQGGWTLGSTCCQEVSTSGWHQAVAQLDDRGRPPLIVGLCHPTALVPRTPQPVLPLTAEVDIPTITPLLFRWEYFTPQLPPLLWEECQIFLPHYKPELLHSW